MDDSSATKQISQMCAFILQEAREKANEIAIKVRRMSSLGHAVSVHQIGLGGEQWAIWHMEPSQCGHIVLLVYDSLSFGGHEPPLPLPHAILSQVH